ncbi:SsgA family sporulation/cell division regulator [Streptomyces sp. KR55]|uniref:SsgA family sporulation/cell division regulator n=1 Tax=Streptomyces sp. KR55 TaxID=3457425 RepID=UPI003FD205D4
MAIRIDEPLYMELVLTAEERMTVPTQLRYEPHDPFAVCLDFHVGTDLSVPWFMARDLLAEGLYRPTGQGDVRVWPTGSGPDAELNLALSSPHGTARLIAPLPVVAQLLRRAYQMVPAGRETERLDLDAELSRLLHGIA